MKATLFVFVISLLGPAAAEACTNMKRLPVFEHSRHAKGQDAYAGQAVAMGRFIVLRHSGGISKVGIWARPSGNGRYTRNGSGIPLPVTVSVSENLCRKGWSRSFTKNLHARLPNTYATRFYAPFKSPRNRAQAVALARTVLRATYCPSGEIEPNPNFRYVDDRGSKPVVRTAPVAKALGDPPLDRTWDVQFTCSEWQAMN